ncbi:MAG: hypothetical protein M0R69_06440 [Candidatus Cloacimonetes bacterium]|jgi:hypothetical protein|nr:hypothetical protein [Candidatus Cloacimonadota bacterium]
MKAPLYLLLLSVLLLSACAHLDNGFMRSAQPLEPGQARHTWGCSSSYTYAAGLQIEPDSLLAHSDRKDKADIYNQIPAGFDLGLGNGLQIGGQMSYALGPYYGYPFECFLCFSDTRAFRGYLQYSLPLENDFWLGISAGILDHKEVWFHDFRYDQFKLKHHGRGFEFPLTITKVNQSSDWNRSNSLTFRYTELKVSSEMKRSGGFGQPDLVYEQADQNISRYAVIYTHQMEGQKIGLFTDLGVEYSQRDGDIILVAPVLGFKLYFHSHPFGKNEAESGI